MADSVLPIVRLLFPCDDAVYRLEDEKWVLTNPWAVVALPPGATFPFDLKEMWLYAQLTDGVGEFDLSVEIRRVRQDETREIIGRGQSTRMEFLGGQQLRVTDTAFHLGDVPFDKAGLYEFVVMANYAELQGQTALLRVLDSRDTL